MLAGKKLCVEDVWNACCSYSGRPFNIYDPDDCPPPFRSLVEVLLKDKREQLGIYKQVGILTSMRLWSPECHDRHCLDMWGFDFTHDATLPLIGFGLMPH